MEKILRGVLRAETQAIAIYTAEMFWIKNPTRRAALLKIREEEIEHQNGLAPFSPLIRISLKLDRISGLLLGTLLSALPWSVLCSVQSWAENEAAKIYAQAAKALRDHGGDLPLGLLEKLQAAERQEQEHSLFFQGPARKLY